MTPAARASDHDALTIDRRSQRSPLTVSSELLQIKDVGWNVLGKLTRSMILYRRVAD
jgi:hypothetical protein